MPPLVSVVVPNYNCEEYLDKCLQHLVDQTYENIEILVCDNGSSDSSVAIIKKWAAKDERIKVLINKVNQGLINCYNRMFFEAKGDYVMIQDADDWCAVDRVEKQLNILETHDVGLCLTNSVFYSELTEPDYQERHPSGLITAESDEVWAPATIMFRREILETVGGFHKYFDRLTSYDRYMILDILDRYKGYYLDEYLYFVWARPDSDHRSIDLTEKNALRKMISHDVYKEMKRIRVETGTDWLKEDNWDGAKAYEKKLLNNNTYMANHFRRFACIQIDHGNYKDGWKLLKRAFKRSPFYLDNYKTLRYLLSAKSFSKQG